MACAEPLAYKEVIQSAQECQSTSRGNGGNGINRAILQVLLQILFLQVLRPDMVTDHSAQGCKAEQCFYHGGDAGVVLAVKEMGTGCLRFVSTWDQRNG